MGTPLFMERTYHRFGIQAAIAREVRRQQIGLVSGPSQLPALIDRQGRWFRAGSQPRVDLECRQVLRRMVAALIESHCSSAQKPLSSQELIDRTWTGERMLKSAARNRLFVSLARLRRLGFSSFLEKQRAGYSLAPHVELVF